MATDILFRLASRSFTLGAGQAAEITEAMQVNASAISANHAATSVAAYDTDDPGTDATVRKLVSLMDCSYKEGVAAGYMSDNSWLVALAA